MNRYWLRITLGALGIFALGMVVVAAGRQGVDKVKQIAMQHTLTLTPGVAPFLVDLRQLGTLTEVEVDPDAGHDFPFINLTVQLDSNADIAGLEECLLLASDAKSVTADKGLRCAQGISPDSLVEMGAVTFEPSGETMPIFIPVGELGDSPWFNRITRRTRQVRNGTAEGSVDLQASAAGAFMLIKDEKGRPVFQLNADSQGAFIQIRDSNGKEVVRFRADSQGVVGRVLPN